MSLKNPVTPPGIDPGTIQLVAQRLNQYATPDPKVMRVIIKVEGLIKLSHSSLFILCILWLMVYYYGSNAC
jgi:hypothetical protein